MDGCALGTVNTRVRKRSDTALGRSMMRRDARMKRDAFLADVGTRPLIMGILNVTPDLFFDSGRYLAGAARPSPASWQIWSSTVAISLTSVRG